MKDDPWSAFSCEAGYRGYPQAFVELDRQANELQRSAVSWKAGQLILLLMTGALHSVSVVGQKSVYSSARGWIDVLSVVFLMSAVMVEWFLMRERTEDGWYGRRAAAEGVKSETWKYMMQAGNYAQSASTVEDFCDEVQGILDRVKESQPTPCVSEVTHEMRSTRRAPVEARLDGFLKHRIEDQRAYFGKASIRLGRKARRWSRVSELAIVVALLVSVASLALSSQLDSLPVRSNIVSFLITLAGLAVTWNAARGFAELSRHHATRSGQLARFGRHGSRLLSELPHADHDEAQARLSDLVCGVEDELMRENQDWQSNKTDLTRA